MSVQTPETKDEQDKAYDPAQKRFDREFNSLVDHNKTAGDLKEQEQQAGAEASDFGQWEKEMADDGKVEPSATSNIDAAKASEATGAGWRTRLQPGNNKNLKGKTKGGGWRRNGPIAAIGGSLLTMAFLGFSGLTFMPVTIMEHFTNDTNDANKSAQRKFINIFGKKTNGSDFKKRLSVCSGGASFRCQLRTSPQNLADRLEKENFKLHDKTVLPNGRIGFSALEFPDGSIAHNGKELSTLLRDPDRYARFSSVYSLKNALFLIGDWFKGVLTKFNLTKGKKIEGKTKQEADKSFEDSTKGQKGTASVSAVGDNPGENATEEQKRAAQAANDSGNDLSREVNDHISRGQRLKKLSLNALKKFGNALAIPQLACLTYNMANFIAVSAKIKKAMYFAGFAMIFLTLASSIKANKATEAEVAKGMDVLAPSTYPDKVEDPETGQMVANPNIGKNALDSEAYKVVAYGDQINLSAIAAKFFIAGGVLGFIQNVISWINDKVGKQTIKTACKVVNSTVAQVIAFLAAPVISAVILGIVHVFPVEEWAAQLVNSAIDALAGPDFTTGVKGVDAGNVLFIGAATILGGAAIKFGLKPGKLAAIRKNVADNHELLQQEIAVKTHEASKTPLDITNRYSFLGSMAAQLASFMPSLEKPVTSSVGKILSAIPGSFTMLTKNANAAYSMPVSDYTETRFSQCKDEVYQAMKKYFDCDMFGVLRPVPDNEIDSEAVLTYLENTNNIDKMNADPIPGSFTEKYKKYCVDRTDPWGSTSISTDEQTDDPAWYTGEKCFITDTMPEGEKTLINMSSEYVGYKVSEGTISSYPKIKDTPTPEEAFWTDGSSIADDSTYTALSKGMSYMLEGAY